MLVEKRQRRPTRIPQSATPRCFEKQPMGSSFNPILEVCEDAMDFGEDNDPRRSSGVMEAAAIPRQQGISATEARQHRAISVRKPLTIADFPIVSRDAPRAGSSRNIPGKHNTSVHEKSRHSVVVISENSDPNCPTMDVGHVAPSMTPNPLTWGKLPDSYSILPIGSSMIPSQAVHGDPSTNMLESILDQEELLWRQKSCSDWIVLGDHNTQYFHMRAISRRQKQRITSLQLPNGEWCSNVDSLRAAVADYFKALFTADVRPPNRLPVHGCFPRLSQEIYSALMEMAPLKSPGWDGLHRSFIRDPAEDCSCQSLVVNEYSRFSTLGYVLQWSLPAAICIPNLFGQRLLVLKGYGAGEVVSLVGMF
ncbi:hypothetical protein GQ457_16G013010 [Hibiscus cannabinus]